MARLLSTLLFTLEGGFDAQLQDVLGPALYPSGLLPSLAAGASAAIHDLQAAFPYCEAAPCDGLEAFAASVHGLATVGDDQRRAVGRALRRYRARSAARQSWGRLIDAALQQPRGRRSDSADGGATPPQLPVPEGADEGDGQAGPAPAREASLAGWLRRVGSGLVGSSSGSGGAVAAAAKEAAEEADDAASDAGSVGSHSTLASASHAASASRRGLSAALDALLEDEALPVSSLAGGSPAAPAALSPERGLLRGGTPGASPLLSRLDALRDSGTGMPLLLFPETTEGRLAQARVCGEGAAGRRRSAACRRASAVVEPRQPLCAWETPPPLHHPVAPLAGRRRRFPGSPSSSWWRSCRSSCGRSTPPPTPRCARCRRESKSGGWRACAPLTPVAP